MSVIQLEKHDFSDISNAIEPFNIRLTTTVRTSQSNSFSSSMRLTLKASVVSLRTLSVRLSAGAG
ncbi:hypothetical protein [Enterobacter phage 04_vB_Eclo_IJM]|nr:hypothetical protein [Enterobacter phage 04_vB_Eclo_IJM]